MPGSTPTNVPSSTPSAAYPVARLGDRAAVAQARRNVRHARLTVRLGRVPPDHEPAEEAFAAIAGDLLDEPGVEAGTGFGKQPGLRVGGKIFAMLVAGDLVVKLPADRIGALRDAGGARSFEIGARQMREWVAIEPGGRHDWGALARDALAFVRA